MTHPNQVPRSVRIALILATTAQTVLAAPPEEPVTLSPVEVMASMPIQKACPAVDQDLERTLYRVWRDVATPGTVQVEMTLQGQRIVNVSASGGPRAYHRPVRRAVYQLQCDSGQEVSQVVRFQVKFVFSEDHASAAQHVTYDIARN